MQIKEQRNIYARVYGKDNAMNDYKAHKNYAEQQSKWARISNYQLWTMSNEATTKLWAHDSRQTARATGNKEEKQEIGNELWALMCFTKWGRIESNAGGAPKDLKSRYQSVKTKSVEEIRNEKRKNKRKWKNEI